MAKTPYLSVVIPAYKEKDRIGNNLLEIENFLSSKDFDYEIIVIVDGSPDNTAQVAKNYAIQLKSLRVIDNRENHGKGSAVKQGLLEAKGEIVAFLDADGSTSITHLEKALLEIEKGAEVVVGSRKIKGAFVQIHQSKLREMMREASNWLIRIVLGLWNFPDTQCGFKILRAEAAHKIAKQMVVDRFGFDFELIALAKAFGFKIEQIPVKWLNEEELAMSFFGANGYLQALVDLFKIKWNLITGKYKFNK
ncbi:MAG: dolichyl-phosphate beta-glucosyltransferase [Candidatus Moraniibacteriota bacterium]